MPDVKTLFKRHFAYPPVHVVSAPGQLELLGDPSDSNQGLVMSVAVNKSVHIASAPRTDGKIELVSSDFPEHDRFWITNLTDNPVTPWSNGIKRVLAQLRKRGVHFSGFNAAIQGDLPPGSAISHSGPIAVAAALTVRQLYPFSLTETGATIPPKRNARNQLPPLAKAEKFFFARLCHAAQNELAARFWSTLGPIASLFGKAWHAMSIDLRFNTVEHAPLIGETVVICDPGSNPLATQAEEEEMRAQCESAARKLGAKSLRSVELKFLKANQTLLTPREYACAHHFVGETERVVFGERALREDDHRQFGQYMFQSCESARELVQNQRQELQLLIQLARAHRGCLGARLAGGGFGGATINLVAYHQAENFMQTISRLYEKRVGSKLQPMLCQIVDGAAGLESRL